MQNYMESVLGQACPHNVNVADYALDNVHAFPRNLELPIKILASNTRTPGGGNGNPVEGNLLAAVPRIFCALMRLRLQHVCLGL